MKAKVYRQNAQVRIHDTGFLTVAPLTYAPAQPEVHKRGKIKEWSAKSRRRLRRFLLEHETAVPCHEANVTLTVPGPPLTVEECRKLWGVFSIRIVRKGWAAVWRMEIQARGAVHWHLCASIPVRTVPHWAEARVGLSNLWRDSLRELGPCVHTLKSGTVGDFPDRWNIPGASDYAVHVQFAEQSDGNRWAWRRYLQDHASKGKQEQIAEGFGRHWGVIGRKVYRRSIPEVERLTDRQFFAVLRWHQRMISGTHIQPLAPFGRKRSRRIRRGSIGKAVSFTQPSTIRTMINHARVILPGVES